LAGTAPLTDFLELTRRLSGEVDESVWDAALGPFDMLHRIGGDADRARLAGFVQNLVRPQFNRLGWAPVEGEGQRTGTLRATLMSALGTLGGDTEVRARAAKSHAAYLKDRSSVDPDVLGAVVAITAWTGGEAEFTECLDRARNPGTPQEEVRYLYALPRFRHPGLIRRTLDLALNEFRTQNAPYMVAVALNNRWAGPQGWDWLKEHWDQALSRFPDNSTARMLEGVVGLNTSALAADVHAFLTSHPVPQAQQLVEQTLERLDVNTRFREREAANLVWSLAE
jgi:hypothetical protein